jgi:hypothetical protein
VDEGDSVIEREIGGGLFVEHADALDGLRPILLRGLSLQLIAKLEKSEKDPVVELIGLGAAPIVALERRCRAFRTC